ncbi:MAG TPA: phage holin family protein [Acidimicrobiales bacterium]|nr:phage holin family protein [Acidimicrobiales bacterium]
MATSRQPPPGALQTEPKQADKSLGELVAAMTGEVSELMRKEVQLAKVEIKEEVGRAGKAGGMLGAGAVAGYFALLFVSLALAWLLDQAMPIALAFFLVGLLYAIAAAVLLTRGRDQMKRVDPVPRQTVETLKEDAEWAKAQKS